MPRTQNGLSTERLKEFARASAADALRRLRAEVVAIERTFPELAFPRARRAVRRSVKRVAAGTRTMSAAARRAVSARMKRYWAERKKAQARVK